MISLRALSAAITLLLVLGSYWGVYNHGRAVERAAWEVRWAHRDQADSGAIAQVEADARQEEQRRRSAQEKARAHAQEKQKSADADGSAADAAGQRLRDEAGKFATTISCASTDSAAVARGQAATRAAMVLSDLLSRADARAGEMAKAYDRARIAGQQCESEYNALTQGRL